MEVKIVFILLMIYISKGHGQCTFQTAFASSTWHDNTRGTLVFGTTTMTGWGVTALGQTVNAWQCLDSSDTSTLVIRSQSTITYSTTQIYVYLCMKLTQITDNSYYYYHQHAPELNAGSERLKFSTSTSLTMSEVCDTTVTVPTLEFHVLVKSGSEAASAVTCADTLLYHADYTYSDGTNTACDGSTDYWDVCTDKTQMTFNYTTCSQQIAYSAGGQLLCVANMAYGGYQCSVVFNQDSSIVSSTRQFSCICSNGAKVSVAPNNCTSDQTPTALPTAADGTTVVGHLLTYGTSYEYCGPTTTDDSSTGVGAGLIAGIVIGVLIAVAIAVGVAIYCYFRHRKNRVSESEKPMLTNGAVAHMETVDETSKGALKREKTSISAITRGRTELERSMMTRNATVTSIGLSMKKEKSAVSQVDVEAGNKAKDSKFLGLSLAILPCFKKKDETEKKGDDGETKKKSDSGIKNVLPCFKGNKESESQQEGGKSEGLMQKVLPCLKKKQEVTGAEMKTAEKTTKEKKALVKPKPTAAAKAGKGGKKKVAKGKGKGKAGKGKKTQEARTDTAEEMTVEDVDEKDTAVQTPKKEKTDLLGNQQPQMTSTPIPKPDPSEKSPKLSKKKDGMKQANAAVKNGTGPAKTPVAVNGLAKVANPESKDWTFLSCCFGNRSPPPQGTEDAAGPIQPKKKPSKSKDASKTKTKASTKKPVAKKGGKKGGGKKADGKVKKDNQGKEEENEQPDVEGNKLERAKTMPERPREKTALSVTDAEKVKVDVYIPDENSPVKLKDTVTVVKGKNGDIPKAKSSLGLARPVSSTSSKQKEPEKATKKDKKKAQGAKTKGEKKVVKKKKKK